MVHMRDYPRIIVEGMDGSGKSTLAKKLFETIPNLDYTRNERGPRDDLAEWWMDQLWWNPNKPIPLNDRFFYPELVYGPVLRGGLSVSQATVAYVQEFLRAHAFLIYCRPPINTIRQGIEMDQQMTGVKENFGVLLAGYDNLMKEEFRHYPLDRFVKYDWTSDRAFKSLMGRLEIYLGKHQRH